MTANQTAAVVMEGVLMVSIDFLVNAMLDSKAETVKLVSSIKSRDVFQKLLLLA